MTTAVRRFSNIHPPLAACTALLALLAGGCATNTEPVLTKLDPSTMVTINFINSPFIFFRTPAASHVDAREYVYVGPLESNRSGDYRYYLWLATWSTMDNAQFEQSLERLETVDLDVDGESLTLNINGASPASVGASEAVYPKPVGWATEVYYDVTLEQLQTIAEATDLTLRLPATGENYGPWDDQAASKRDLAEFLMHAQF